MEIFNYASHNFGVPNYIIQEMVPKNFNYVLLIPVINEGNRIRSQLLKIASLNLPIDIVITDGGSTDGSLDYEILNLTGVNSLIKKTSPGFLSTQLRAGFHFCLTQGYQGVVTVDGNDKDDVDCIPRVVEKLMEGFDFVQGSRFVNGGCSENTPLTRELAIRLIHSPLTSLGAKFRFTDSTNGFRGHSAALLSDPRVSIFRNVFHSYELVAYLPIRAGQLGLKTTEVPVGRRYPLDSSMPTKIKGVKSHLRLLVILLRAMLRKYNPEHKTIED